jgi:purine-nucleoside phosphorylase
MLETPAEYRMLRKLGGDAVGMSTIPEVIAANHAGINCSAISVLTDECDPDNLQAIDIQEILKIAKQAEKKNGFTS